MKLLYFLLLTSLSVAAQDHDHDHAVEAHQDEEMEFAVAQGGPVERLVTFPAEVNVNRDRFVAVTPPYGGTVKELFVKIGDRVKQGDRLARIESRDTLSNYELIAPQDGVITDKHIAAGETVGEDSALFDLADLSSVWIKIHLFSQYRSAVRIGQRVLLTAPDDAVAEVTVDYVSPLIDQETRTLTARAILHGASAFTPGLLVQASLAVESAQARVRVEREAVQQVNGEPVVFVRDAHGVEPRDIQIGLAGSDYIEIRSGLNPGESYVLHGAFDLKAELVTSGLDPHAGHGH
ncbi:MAG: efflux RND transporter periplasmic adaptor subunit [Kiritimatiellales bacterium]